MAHSNSGAKLPVQTSAPFGSPANGEHSLLAPALAGLHKPSAWEKSQQHWRLSQERYHWLLERALSVALLPLLGLAWVTFLAQSLRPHFVWGQTSTLDLLHLFAEYGHQHAGWGLWVLALVTIGHMQLGMEAVILDYVHQPATRRLTVQVLRVISLSTLGAVSGFLWFV